MRGIAVLAQWTSTMWTSDAFPSDQRNTIRHWSLGRIECRPRRSPHKTSSGPPGGTRGPSMRASTSSIRPRISPRPTGLRTGACVASLQAIRHAASDASERSFNQPSSRSPVIDSWHILPDLTGSRRSRSRAQHPHHATPSTTRCPADLGARDHRRRVLLDAACTERRSSRIDHSAAPRKGLDGSPHGEARVRPDDGIHRRARDGCASALDR